MKKRIVKGLLMLCTASTIFCNSHKAEAKEDFRAYLPAICEEYGISECLMEALILTESSGNRYEESSYGAIGLCQIVPRYHKDRMERLGVSDLYDVEGNIRVCVDYLMELAGKYEDVYLVLSAYSSGENSKTFKRVLEGSSNAYADKVLEKAFELEQERYGGNDGKK